MTCTLKGRTERLQVHRHSNTVTEPPWLKSLKRGNLSDGAMKVVARDGEIVRVNEGDWLVLVEDRTVVALTEAEFKEHFQANNEPTITT